MRAVIVASGPSARGFIPPEDVVVIAVNGAATWLPRMDQWFSLDASPDNRRHLFVAHERGARCHVAGEPWLLHARCMRIARYWTRVHADPHRGPLPDTPEGHLRLNQAVLGINKTPGHINTGNSAWGALGLAWHMGFDDVALVGVDASTGERCEGGHSRNLSHLPLLFASALPDMRVVSCGALDSVPQMTFGDWWYENR